MIGRVKSTLLPGEKEYLVSHGKMLGPFVQEEE